MIQVSFFFFEKPEPHKNLILTHHTGLPDKQKLTNLVSRRKYREKVILIGRNKLKKTVHTTRNKMSRKEYEFSIKPSSKRKQS